MRRTVAGLVVLVGAVLCGCEPGPPDFEGAVVRAVDVPGGPAYVVAPRGPGPHPLALYTHGAGAPEKGLLAYRRAFIQDLVDHGFVVAAAYAGGPAWGDAASQAAYRALYERATADHDVGDVVVVSESMGGVAGLHLVAGGGVPARAWVGISPVTNLPATAGVARLRPSIARALSADDVAALDPMRLDLDGVRLVVYADPADRVVPTADNGAALPGAELRPCTGGHVAVGCFRAAEIAALLDGWSN